MHFNGMPFSFRLFYQAMPVKQFAIVGSGDRVVAVATALSVKVDSGKVRIMLAFLFEVGGFIFGYKSGCKS